MKKAHRSEFLKAVKTRFPEIKERINKEAGLLTFEISVFIQFIQRKIDSNKREEVIDAFDILSNYYVNGTIDLHQSIRNAVCEDLDFTCTDYLDRAWAFDILPIPLKEERRNWYEFMGYESE